MQNRWLYECRLPFLPELQMVDNDLEVFDKRFRKWNSATDLTNYSNFDKVWCLLLTKQYITFILTINHKFQL